MPRFLIVDDDAETVTALTALLRQDGHEVCPVTSGAGALQALSRESFDVVMTDLKMQDVPGEEVVRITRERLPDACLIVVTVKAGSEEELRKMGACVVVEKPMNYASVLTAILECRARRGSSLRGGCYLKSNDELHLTQLRRR
jgi:two-component system response regulator HydG